MYIYIYYHPQGTSLDRLKLMILIILGACWVYQGLLDMLRTIVSNSHFGRRPIDKEMTTFGPMLAPKV